MMQISHAHGKIAVPQCLTPLNTLRWSAEDRAGGWGEELTKTAELAGTSTAESEGLLVLLRLGAGGHACLLTLARKGRDVLMEAWAEGWRAMGETSIDGWS